MGEGYIKLWRKLLDDQVFHNEKLLKIWVWCLMKASYKEYDTLVGMTPVTLQPGQFVFGRTSAAEELKTNESTLYKYMMLLQSLENIVVNSNNRFSIVTICNWETYQGNGIDEVTTKEQQKNNKRTTKEHKQEVKEGKESKEDKTDNAQNEFEREQKFIEFWTAYPRKIGKAKCSRWWNTHVKTSDLADTIISAVRNQRRLNMLNPENNYKFCPHPMTWLNAGRWEDKCVESAKCDKCGARVTLYQGDDNKCDCGGRYR